MRPKSTLFDVFEYEHAYHEFFTNAVSEFMKAKDQLYRDMSEAAASENLPTTQNTMPSGAIVENRPVEMENKVLIQWDDVRSCSVSGLACQIESVADERLSVMMPHFFDTFRRTCDAAGTSTNVGGQPFSFETYLAGLEKVEIRFTSEGQPILPDLVVSPQLGEHIKSLPPWTAEQQKAYDDLIENKRKEFNARRRYRKLH